MIRRGIPYGPLLEGAADDGIDRGLHFFCVVEDVVRQFEFIQSNWLNQANFPTGQVAPTNGPYVTKPGHPADGPDPLVGEKTGGQSCVVIQSGGNQGELKIAKQLVTVTAGEYFFLPSISSIGAIAGGTTA
jgi:hypothetical protein